ncbi:protein SOSEKI 2-like isoform X2 [Oryza brachyantha]|uniref:protein SOSEKI 2-like isoform X2 n=1 Tax=Oryza brachyantha TaxID=4533 RepID=UPI001ADA8B03|nr:protein SOSEKI 2-like isoform X2 [Oryza brachyantha]
MEVAGAAMEGRKVVAGRAEASPERGRPAYAPPARSAPARPMRKVQIIYYLCRNGQLEHPHFMELAQHPHQPLRLKDVMDKLTLLRGKGMPALFSWSCKRNYKNGYVWNDLSENDVIYPSDGVEYVLKGSEIFPGCSSDRFTHLRVTDRSPAKRLALPPSHKQYMDSYRDDAGEDPEDDELAYTYHRRAGAHAAARLAAKPVSARTNRSRPVELPVEETSPPSSTSSDKPPAAQQLQPGRGDETESNRAGSMLLQLIACGSATGGGSAKCRTEPRRSCGLVSRLAASRAGTEDDDEDGDGGGGELSRRFGHLAVEEKEYFSGSIVESGGRGTPLPSGSLKRSNSYNEERSSRHGVGEERSSTAGEQMEGEEGMIRGRCIPGRKKQQK